MAGVPKVKKAQAIALLVEGLTPQQAASELGFPRTTIASWMKNDPEFVEQLEAATDNAIESVINDATTQVRRRISLLSDKAFSILADSLDANDPKLALSAARDVFKIGGVMARDSGIFIGLETQLAQLDDTDASRGD